MKRFYVDQRNGIVAVSDRMHPKYEPDRQGCHADLPWVVASWHGDKTPGYGLVIQDWQIEKANHLCDMLNCYEMLRAMKDKNI